MDGFTSGGRSWGGGVVLRVSRSGWVWALRVTRPADGSFPAPACVYIPMLSRPLAAMWAVEVARALGWRVWVRSARRVSSAPWEVKVALPSGLPVHSARAQLPPLPSVLAALGV